MVIHEHFVTRRPLLFLIIVMTVLVLLYAPARILVQSYADRMREAHVLEESYEEVWKWFNSDSPLNIEEKQELYWIKYNGNVVEWQGMVLGCKDLGNIRSVKIDHRGTSYADVVFSTLTTCDEWPIDKTIRYRMEIIDWRVNVFVGKEGSLMLDQKES
ncbi:hypothetical protein ACFL0V_03585 [Nanoarchaeota archaeon]